MIDRSSRTPPGDRDLIVRGIQGGKIPSQTDPELATSTLLGAIFYRRLMTGNPFNPHQAEQLVTFVLG